MKTLISLMILLVSQQALAFDKEDSFGDFQAALMESNKDYNDSKKSALEDDNKRIAEWNDHEQTTIEITRDINTSFELSKESKEELKPDVQPLHEVSMND